MQQYIFKILLLILLTFSFSCKNSTQKEQLKTEEINHSEKEIHITKDQFTQNNMQLGSIEEKPFPITIKTTGIIDVPPQNRAVVSATMGGYIKTTPLLIGDVVKKGQALVTVENPAFITLQQNYLEAKEQLTYLKSEYDRQKTLLAENITSQKSFLKAQSNYNTKKASYNGLRKQLTMLHISPTQVEKGNITTTTTIYAPISGSITKVNVVKGTYVSPATEILEIIDNEHIHIELTVFEKDIMKIKKHQKIFFKIPESSSEIYEADVHLIGTSIEANRTIKVHGHLKNTKHNFLTGMFVDAEIVIESILSKALPETAFVEIDEEMFVLKLAKTEATEYDFEQLEVKTGKTYNGFVEILNTEQLKPSTKFLTLGAFSIAGESAGGHSH